MKNISWSIHSFIAYLRIDSCSFSDYQTILRHLSRLNTLIMHRCSMYDVDSIRLSPWFSYLQYRQLLPLSIESIPDVKMEILSLFLSVTPSLQYLKLIGSVSLTAGVSDGLQWTNFLQKNFHSLNKFQFYFQTKRNLCRNLVYITLLIDAFSTEF